MKTKNWIAFSGAWLLIFFLFVSRAQAQNQQQISLQQAIDSALQNNRLITIRDLQIAEKKAKIQEDRSKALPVISVNSTYQYNVNVGELVIPAGSFGTLPLSPVTMLPLPNEDKSFELGNHHTFSAGVSLYQPLTQQGKIKSGVDIAKVDMMLSEKDKIKASQQISQAVEKLYYGLLINQKQQEEARLKLELSNLRLHDVESALASGKIIEVSKAGLMANIADEEQNLVKLSIQADDYMADFKRLTHISSQEIFLGEVELDMPVNNAGDQSQQNPDHNIDVQIATLQYTKATLGVGAAKRSFAPDLGLIAGYTYQKGNVLFPTNNPYAGINFKWTIQDIYTNSQVLKQRKLMLKQVEENIENTKEQISAEMEKASRKVNQALELVKVAEKVVKYRREELKAQTDRFESGLCLWSDVLNVKSLLAKAESDLYAARLNYRLSVSELKILAGK